MTPIWVVNGKVPSPDILLAVDGSQGALRALDHICFMLKDTGKPHLNIIHVQPKFSDYCSIDITQEAAENAQDIILSGHHQCIDNFFSQAQAMIQDHGHQYGSCDVSNTPQTNVHYANPSRRIRRRGGFGTIVLGRRVNQSQPCLLDQSVEKSSIKYPIKLFGLCHKPGVIPKKTLKLSAGVTIIFSWSSSIVHGE